MRKMTKRLYSLIHNYPVSCFYVAVIWVLCFMDVPDTPLRKFTLADKWTHIVMYAGTCGTMWYEYLQRHEKVRWRRVLAFAVLAPVLMGGLIEILQACCTGGRRTGDWLDFAANGIGVAAGTAIGILQVWCRARRKKGCQADGSCRSGGRL